MPASAKPLPTLVELDAAIQPLFAIEARLRELGYVDDDLGRRASHDLNNANAGLMRVIKAAQLSEVT